MYAIVVVVQLCEVGAIAHAWEEGGGRRELVRGRKGASEREEGSMQCKVPISDLPSN